MKREQSDQEAQIEKALQSARAVQAMAQMPGWAIWTSWIEEGIELRREALCRIGLDEKESERLRGEIQLLRQLLIKSDAALDIEKFSQAEKHLRVLQAQGEARHYLRDSTQGTP